MRALVLSVDVRTTLEPGTVAYLALHAGGARALRARLPPVVPVRHRPRAPPRASGRCSASCCSAPGATAEMAGRRPLVGWTPGPAPHARVACATLQQLRRAAALRSVRRPGWGRAPVRVCEHTLAPALQLCCARGLVRSGWVEVPRLAPPLPAGRRVSTCEQEYTVALSQLQPLPDCNDIAPLLFGSFDIEVYSHDGSFPQARRPRDAIIQIGITLRRYGDETDAPRSLMLCLGATDPVDGVELRIFDTEAALLGGFAAAEDVDIWWSAISSVLTWGTWRSAPGGAGAGRPVARRARGVGGARARRRWRDRAGREGRVLEDRLAALLAQHTSESSARSMWDAVGGADAAVIEPFFHLGRVRQDLSFPYAKSMSNAAMGDNTLHLIEMQGRVWFDLYQHIKNNFKLTQYNLNFVSEHFLGPQAGRAPVADLRPVPPPRGARQDRRLLRQGLRCRCACWTGCTSCPRWCR